MLLFFSVFCTASLMLPLEIDEKTESKKCWILIIDFFCRNLLSKVCAQRLDLMMYTCVGV